MKHYEITERRRAVTRYYRNGLSIEAIADLIGVSVQTVRSDLVIMGIATLPVRYTRQETAAMTMDYVWQYKRDHPPGTHLNVMGGLTVIRDNGRTVQTNKGCYQWKELALRHWRKTNGMEETEEYE